MTTTVDLNADMGEGFGPWTMGDDAALLDIVTSANIACGAHAGDWDTLAATIAAARDRGVGIGAHPGFADLQGFGRQRMKMPISSLKNLIAFQVGAADGIARAVGTKVRHLKLHGALANMASEDEGLARACYEAALAVCPDLILMVMAGTAQQRAAAALGVPAACEIFADRAYNDDLTLVDRSLPAAVLHDADAAADRILTMLDKGGIVTTGGGIVPARIDTICLHGDSAGAVAMARTLRTRLEAAGVTLAPFAGAPV